MRSFAQNNRDTQGLFVIFGPPGMFSIITPLPPKASCSIAPKSVS
jgi:hypothetical protein